MREEINTMPTKTLVRDEILGVNNLRNLSQKNLMEMVDNNEKLGLIANNELAIAMIRWDKYEKIIDLLESQQHKIEMLESLFEDSELAKMYGEHIEQVEKGNSKTHRIEKPEDVFKML